MPDAIATVDMSSGIVTGITAGAGSDKIFLPAAGHPAI